jgi:glycine oxidase
LKSYEPTLNSNIKKAWSLPEFCQVRNPRHLKALLAGCAARNVRILAGEAAYHFEVQNGKVSSVRTNNGAYTADQFIITSGAWTGQLLHSIGYKIPIEPVRGQIVLLSATPGLIRHVIEYGPRYLVPRPDGRILIGSTVEQVGFNKSNTAGAVSELIAFGSKLVPALEEATFERCWAGLRPRTPDNLPLIGPVTEFDNLLVAAGHFRDGLQLSPITAILIRQLLLKQSLTVPLEPFACNRFRESVYQN